MSLFQNVLPFPRLMNCVHGNAKSAMNFHKRNISPLGRGDSTKKAWWMEAWKNCVVIFQDVLAMHIFYVRYYSYCVSAIGAAFWALFCSISVEQKDVWNCERNWCFLVMQILLSGTFRWRPVNITNCKGRERGRADCFPQAMSLILSVCLRTCICVCAHFPAVLSFCHKEQRIYYSEWPHSIDAHTCLRQSMWERGWRNRNKENGKLHKEEKAQQTTIKNINRLNFSF